LINKYIYKIEVSDDDIIIIHFYTYRKNTKIEVRNKNFRIRYYRNPRHMPVCVFEQHSHYKLLYKQYCIGYWKDEKNIEIFAPYASVIEYHDFK